MAETLLDIERALCRNPPRQEELMTARGLRGGSAILMVAAFEQFLRAAIEEHLSRLTVQPLKVRFDTLPESMRVTSVFGTLERSMRGPPFQEAPPRAHRLEDIEIACKLVLSGVVNPAAFADTGGNPDSKNVTLLFKQMGLQTVFDRIHSPFVKRWRSPVAHTFISDKLDEIVQRRHVVAHTASALDISRADMRESIRFLKVLAALLDAQLDAHVRSLI